jgi:putative aldouronate transport system substrate-binding protein
MKKLIALLLALAMVLALAACGNSGSTGETGTSAGTSAESGDKPAQIEKIRIYVPTSGKYDDIDAVMEKVNEITREKIAVEVEFVPFQFGQWFGQYSLFLSGTEDVDILVNYGGFLNAYSQGACYDLTDLIQQYGQDIIAMEGDYLKGGVIDGRQYALPIYAVYSWNMGIIYRQDVVEELGLQDQVAAVKTIEDWEPILAAVKEAKPDMTPFVTSSGSTAPNFQYGTWDDLGNKYGVLMNGGETSEVVNLFETEEYARLCNVMHDWNVKGYSSKDIQTQTDGFTVLTQSDAAFCTLGQVDFNTPFYQSTTIGKPINVVQLAPAVGRTYNNVTYIVMSNTKHPEAAMKFLNLWFSDIEVGNLIKYGIEGTHYQVNADGMAEYLPGQDANSCTYHIGASISNVNSIRWNTENPDYAQLLIDSNTNSPKSVALGFAFNTENVTNEITQLDNVCAKYQIGLESGAMDPATALPEFIQALKDAGIEKVIAEKQAQLDAFLGK